MLKVTLDRMRNFWQRERGAITVEFVVTLPILLAVLTFVQQYGEAMRIMNAMDIGVRDAARFLSRAPIDEATGTVPDVFLCTARGIVTDRLAIFGASTIRADVADATPMGCSGLYRNNTTGAVATFADGANVADSVVLFSDANQVVVGASYEVDLTFARMFARRCTDVTWSVPSGGQEQYTFTARTNLPSNEEELDRKLIMTVSETWPRTQ